MAALAIAMSGALVIAACGNDDTEVTDDEETEVTDDEETTSDDEETTGDDEEAADGETVEVVGTEYEFQGIPATVPVGTRFTFRAEGNEAHEMVVFRLSDDEERSVDEIVQLPEAELEAMFAEPPAFVLLANPNEDGFAVEELGDGTVTEPGRYIAVCFFETGTTEVPEGPPEGGENPPHAAHGMFAEFTVE